MNALPRSLSSRASVLLTVALSVSLQAGGSLPASSPARQGMSNDRLEQVARTAEAYVKEGKHAGVSVLIARHGKIVHASTHGFRDIEAKLPMTSDTICRVYSMSKIVTSVAVLKLMEEGKLHLDDPVTKFWPELADRKVLAGGTTDSPQLEKANTPITIRHLLTHTAGYAYDFSASAGMRPFYDMADLWSAASMSDFIGRVAKLPLLHEPGTKYNYGIHTDILGAVVEKASGQSFEAYLRQAIFDPLKMKDSSFNVPAEKRDRLAKTYQNGDGAAFKEVKPLIGVSPDAERGIAEGGAGLFATIGDYARFAQMLLNKGELDGERILSPKTVELMTQNHLSHLNPPHHGEPSRGFGLGVEVLTDLSRSKALGSEGQFGWYGAATTYCQIDPKEDLLAIAFVQHFPFNQHNFFHSFANSYYQAIEK